MPADEMEPLHGPGRSLAAWGVHFLTASGAVWALCAIDAISRQRFRIALAWMGLALLVDGVDGTLARRARVSRLLPAIDGALLDNLVDYLNYVVVPAYLLIAAPVLPPWSRWIAAAAVCLASAYQFCQVEAKPDGRFFRGFPSYWNVVVFYLLMIRMDPTLALVVVLALCALVFVPALWVYPSRTPVWRRTTLLLTAAWGVSLVWLFFQYPEPDPWLTAASLGYVAYHAALGAALTLRGATQ